MRSRLSKEIHAVLEMSDAISRTVGAAAYVNAKYQSPKTPTLNPVMAGSSPSPSLERPDQVRCPACRHIGGSATISAEPAKAGRLEPRTWVYRETTGALQWNGTNRPAGHTTWRSSPSVRTQMCDAARSRPGRAGSQGQRQADAVYEAGMHGCQDAASEVGRSVPPPSSIRRYRQSGHIAAGQVRRSAHCAGADDGLTQVGKTRAAMPGDISAFVSTIRITAKKRSVAPRE
jgi:hypothetical protein